MLNELLEFEEYSYSKRPSRLSITNMTKGGTQTIKTIRNNFTNYSFSGISRPLYIVAKKYFDPDNPLNSINAIKAWLGYKDIDGFNDINGWFVKYLKQNKAHDLLKNHSSRIDSDYYLKDSNNSKYIHKINISTIVSNVVDDYELYNYILVSRTDSDGLRKMIQTKSGNKMTNKSFGYLLKLTAYYLLQNKQFNVLPCDDEYTIPLNIIKVDYSNWCGVEDYKSGNVPFRNFINITINNKKVVQLTSKRGNESPKLSFLNEWIEQFDLIKAEQLNDYKKNHTGSYYIDDGKKPLICKNI